MGVGISVILMGCFSEFPEQSARYFVDNPKHDYDGDGLLDAEDCDDSNAAIRKPITYFLDADQDSYPNESVSVLVCPTDKPDGYIEATGKFDCNDDDDTLHPADADGDGVSSCDGDCDDANRQVTTTVIFYQDFDGDGFPTESISATVCPADKPDGYIEAATGFDCNDNDDTIHPADADSDGVSTCDGDCDDANQEVISAITYYQDSDGDGFGVENTTVVACPSEQPTGYVVAKERNEQVVFDCNDSSPLANPDGIERCDLLDNDCNGITDDYFGADAPVWYVDSDGDGFGAIAFPLTACEDENGHGPSGYVINFLDCDDNHAESHPYLEGAPGGVEVCDNNDKDENCDGLINDPSASDAQIWYRDADNDDYGNVLINQRSCTQPTGFVLDNTDCNDAEVLANPGLLESCDSIDNDCDGAVDEADASNVVEYFLDFDGDTFGDASEVIAVCPLYQPSNYVEDNRDCDDLDGSQNPSVLERCSGEDDDCDGAVDEDNGSDPAVGSPTWYTDVDGDQFGNGAESLVQCAQPSNHVQVIGDCDDTDALIHPDAVELCTLDVDENCDGDNTYGVPSVDLPYWYPDSDGDGYGNPSFVIRLCEQPQNYVPNPDDCNDTDFYVHPQDSSVHEDEVEADGTTYIHRERCNGKVDLCENDLLGDLTPLDNELDNDQDGYVECLLDVDPVLWEHPTQSITNGGDCDDTADYRYPGAVERCNGVYEDCDTLMLLGGVPADEVDNDFDCFVECSGFDPVHWEGGAHSCSFRDANSVVVNETTVIGGDDCNDNASFTYVGAAPQINPDACLTDFDGDGLSDRSWDLCSTEMTWDDSRYMLYGTSSYSYVTGWGVGNFDGDNIPDLLYSSGVSQRSRQFKKILPGSLFSNNTSPFTESDYSYGISTAIYGYSARVNVLEDIDGDGLSEFSDSSLWSTLSDMYRPGVAKIYLSSTFSSYPDPTFTVYPVADIFWEGEDVQDYLAKPTTLGDLDNDGLAELMMVASGAKVNFTPTGITYLYNSSTLNTLSGQVSTTTADQIFLQAQNFETMDFDGDSKQDLIFYNSDIGTGGYYSAYVWLFTGASLSSLPSEVPVSLSPIQFTGDNYISLTSPKGVGDIDGDGLEELSINRGSTETYIISGATLVTLLEEASGSAHDVVESAMMYFDAQTHKVGDLDADGLDEIMVDGHLFFGSTLVSLLTEAASDTGTSPEPLLIELSDSDLFFPESGRSMGDLDNDGLSELLICDEMASYAALEGGICAIYSACDN